MRKTFTILQKHNAGLKRIINSSDGGAFSVLMIGLAGLLVMILIFLYIVDLSIYSYKKRIIASAIDNGVSAAVQEIDVEKSREGIAKAFSNDGKVSMTDIFLDEIKADKAFVSTVLINSGIDINTINGNMVRLAASPVEGGVYYSIRDKNGIQKGNLVSMLKLEDLLNTRMCTLGGDGDKHTVYVNSNTAANSFENRPYYMVFIRNYEIDGLMTNRKATFICFKSAKIYR